MLLPVAEGGHRNFPSMCPEKTGENDFAALLQAYVELTQILSSAHVRMTDNDYTLFLAGLTLLIGCALFYKRADHESSKKWWLLYLLGSICKLACLTLYMASAHTCISDMLLTASEQLGSGTAGRQRRWTMSYGPPIITLDSTATALPSRRTCRALQMPLVWIRPPRQRRLFPEVYPARLMQNILLKPLTLLRRY